MWIAYLVTHCGVTVNIQKGNIASFNVDSGANCCAVVHKQHFIHFKSGESTIQCTDGSSLSSYGHGIVIVTFPGDKMNTITPLFAYWVPNSPRNTISPGSLRTHSSFLKVEHSLYDKCSFTTSQNHSWSTSVNTLNGLDYIDLQTYRIR